jgi:hypothetical protein
MTPADLSRYARAEATFERQQSLEMRCREWESRSKPYRGYGRDLAKGFGWGAVLIPGIILAFVALKALAEMWGG